MFQLDWAQRRNWASEKVISSRPTTLNRDAVRSISLLFWEEHCHECAPPDCYASCPLYIPRADKKCARFVYGIYPNLSCRGLFDFGADVRFRRWGKLETKLYGKSLSLVQYRSLTLVNSCVTSIVRRLSALVQPLSPNRRLNGALSYFRSKTFEHLSTGNPRSEFDDFVLECFSPDAEPFRLIIECHEDQLTFRQSFEMLPGLNYYTVPVEVFNCNFRNSRGRLAIFPDDNAERRLIFTWLHFVKYKDGYRSPRPPSPLYEPTPKVKCVAWDLDNTLWEGTVGEDGVEKLRLRSAAVQLIKRLDEKGILQTVVSKNNHSEAWSAVMAFNLQDYFLFPAINWRPKSQNVRAIATKLNIGLDSFALIDDSAFERSEVSSTLSQVRVYSDEEIGRLASYEEFAVPVTETSKVRRSLYSTDIRRQEQRETFAGDYESFLRSCEIRLRLFVPRDNAHIQRCLELIQRANQLNMSGRRYSDDDLRVLLLTAGVVNVALECGDKFGDYGIVGFASVDERDDKPIVRDLVLSCRVAQKRIEHTFLAWCARRQAARGKSVLVAGIVRTGRNTPLLQVFDDLHFRVLSEDNSHLLMELDLGGKVVVEDIVHVQSSLEDCPPGADGHGIAGRAI